MLHGSNKIIKVWNNMSEEMMTVLILSELVLKLNFHARLRWKFDCNSSSNAAVIISRGVVGYAGVTSFSSREF